MVCIVISFLINSKRISAFNEGYEGLQLPCNFTTKESQDNDQEPTVMPMIVKIEANDNDSKKNDVSS